MVVKLKKRKQRPRKKWPRKTEASLELMAEHWQEAKFLGLFLFDVWEIELF
jgi:hypothetical protein